jgi:hypothetical protein
VENPDSSKFSAKSLEKIGRVVDFASLKLRATTFDQILTSRIVLPFALNAALISGYMLTNQIGQSRWLSVTFLVAGIGLLTILLVQKTSDRRPLQIASAAGIFISLAALASSLSPTAVVLSFSTFLSFLALLVAFSRIHARELALAPLYAGLFAATGNRLADGPTYILFAPLALAAWALWRVGKSQKYGFGILVAGFFILVRYSGSTSAVIVTIIIGGVLMLANGFYEYLWSKTNISNFKAFLFQGITSLTLLGICFTLIPDDTTFAIRAWAASYALFVLASLLARWTYHMGTHAVWLALSLLTVIWRDDNAEFDGSFTRDGSAFRFLLSFALIAILLLVAKRERNRFSHDAGSVLAIMAATLLLKRIVRLPVPVDTSHVHLFSDYGLLICPFVLAFLISFDAIYPKAVPWWHGIVPRRSASFIRRLYRSTKKQIVTMPVVGAMLSVADLLTSVLRYFRAMSKGVIFSDVAVLAIGAISAVALSELLTRSLMGTQWANDVSSVHLSISFFAQIGAWLFYSALFRLWSMRSGQVLLSFVSLCFALVPITSFLIREHDLLADGFALNLSAFLLPTSLFLLLIGLISWKGRIGPRKSERKMATFIAQEAHRMDDGLG